MLLKKKKKKKKKIRERERALFNVLVFTAQRPCGVPDLL